MKTIKKNGIELLVEEVAPDACNFRLGNTFPDLPIGDLFYDTKLNVWNTGNVILQGKNKIIGLLKDITEVECERLVERIRKTSIFVNYLSYTREVGYNNAKQSLISLLQNNGINTDKNLILIEKI